MDRRVMDLRVTDLRVMDLFSRRYRTCTQIIQVKKKRVQRLTRGNPKKTVNECLTWMAIISSWRVLFVDPNLLRNTVHL